ncbi:hypothetical protein MMC30_006151 [Trapelia coarctata]|nr:hypothetical protein [Trapelia coarctata]
MSYNNVRNGYNYSPYYQQQGQQPANTNAQTQSEQANASISYYRSRQEVPAQAPPIGPPQYSSGQASSGGYGDTYEYQSYPAPNTAAESSGQTARGGAQTSSTYNDTNARSYVDTSALGSLAYASALGRNSPTVEQSANAQRRGSSNGGIVSPYSASGNAMSGYSQPKSDSRGSAGAGGSNAKSNTVSPYAASIAANALAQAQKSANRASPQLQYRAPQASKQNQQITTQNYGSLNRASESAYATASQASASAGGSKSANPASTSQRPAYEYPTTSQNSDPTQHKARHSGDQSGYTGGSHGSGAGNSRGLPPLQNTNHPSSTATIDQSRQAGQPQDKRAHQVNSALSAQPTQTDAGQSSSISTGSRYGRSDALSSSQQSNSRSSAQNNVGQHPATVDPSQVFNLQEYQRRKAEAEAEAARKAAEQRKAQSQNSTSSAAPTQIDVQSESQATQASAEPGSKEQIEAEIKAMIEKMREYKAKDPTLFSEVWEQFKKAQPPPRASSQAPQASGVAQTAQAGAVRHSGVISPRFMENGPLPSPSPILNQPSTPSTDNPEQLPDLGKFPFLRRKRKPKEKPGLQGVNTFHEVGASDAEASPMQHTFAARQRPAGPGYGAPGEESMRQAMQAFHGAAQPHNLKFVLPTLSGPTQMMPRQATQHAHPSSASYASPYGSNTAAQQSSYTVWPENKKTNLAAVAKQALESDPANSEKSISADEIPSMLDKNPSYSALCGSLESKGFKFERAEFARVLLSVGPQVSDKTMGLSGPPAVVKRPRRKLDNDSPRRPRGRPRKDGLPPRQHKPPVSAINGTSGSMTTVVAPQTLQNNIPAGYSAAGPHSSSNATQGNTQDHNLAAALTSAIGQIDGQVTRQDTGTYTAGRPLKWDEARQVTAESLRNQTKLDPQTGHVVHSIAGPAPMVNRFHPGFGHSDQVPPMSHLQGQFQPNQSIPQHNQTHRQPLASGSVPPTRSSSSPTVKQQPNPTPVTKEQMARKRNFAEIVDLTQESEEELTYQRKRARLFLNLLNSQNANIPDPAQGTPSDPQRHGPETLIVHSHASTSDVPAKPGPVEPLRNADTPTLVPKSYIDLSRFKTADKEAIARREALLSVDVVQKLNPKHTLKKSAYNPKTIARDILITMGVHPTEKPLNWHLNALRRNFRQVTGSSDLSTFRWDLVDPGGPVLDRTAEDEDADDEADEVPNSGSAARTGKEQSGLAVILPKAITSPARDSISNALLPTNATLDSPPTTTPVGQSAVQPRDVRGRPRGRPRGSKAKLRPYVDASIGLVSQPRPSRGSRGERPPGTHLQPSFTHQSLRMNGAAASTNMAYDSHGNAPLRPSVGAASPTKLDKPASKPTNSIDVVSVAKFPHLATTLAVRVPSMTPSPLQPGEASQKRRGRPPGSTNKSSISRSAHQRSPETENGPRPRGRPPGSKTGTPTRGRLSMRKQAVSHRTTVPDDGIGIIVPSRSPSISSQTLSYVEEKSPQKKGKQGRGRPSHRATSPVFQVFNCRWRGCEAKLHNLETLRKHVFKLHSKKVRSRDDEGEEVEAKVPCLWSGCEQDGIFSSTSGPRRFASEDDWKHHVEKKHLEAMAWELGDGPSAHPSDVEPMSYLSDSQGRQVTPLARTQGPPDPLPAGSGPSPTRAYHKAHGNITEHQKTQAELDPRVATKQAAGVFIGRPANTSNERASQEESEDDQSESADNSDNMDTS